LVRLRLHLPEQPSNPSLQAEAVSARSTKGPFVLLHSSSASPPFYPICVANKRPPSVDKRTGHAVAIKIIDIESAEDEVEDIIQEIAILSELQSPYVTKYYGSYAKGAELWIVMEFCSGGSCADLMKPGLVGEDYIAIIIRELLLGLDYLHSDKKLHRDVKGASRAARLHRALRMRNGTNCHQLRTCSSAPTARSS
jgi:serine/threonine protein kinase